MKARLLFRNFMLLLLVPIFGKTQCITNVSWTITSPTCLTNGVIHMSATGSNLQYKFLTYPTDYTYTGPSNNQLLNGICAGTYSLSIKDTIANCDTVVTIQVNLNYIPPDVYIANTLACTSCNNNGVIFGTISNGSSPYVYKILSGTSHVGDSNNTGTFTGLASGQYLLRGTDNCGVFRSDTCYVVDSSWAITGNTIVNDSCGKYTLTAVQYNGTIPSVAQYSIKSAGLVIASSTTLPLVFYVPPSLVDSTQICVKDIFNCEKCTLAQASSNWSLGICTTDYFNCNIFTVSNINIIGTPVGPLMYGFVNDPYSGLIPNDTIWSSTPSPFSFNRVPYDGIGYEILKDGCGVIKVATVQKYMDLNYGYFISLNNCNFSSINIQAAGRFISPVTYTLIGGTSNTTGNFNNLSDGIYTVKIKDACGDSLMVPNISLSHYWQSKGNKKPHCNTALFDHLINIVKRMKAPIKIVQYNSSYVALDSQTYTNPASFVFSFGISDSFAHVTFYNTLPGTTYHYIMKDDCNRMDTVTLLNGPYSLLPTLLNATVQQICTNKGRVTANYAYYGPNYYPIKLNIWNKNFPGLFSDSITTSLGIGSHTWGYSPNELDTGTYIVKMQLLGSNCAVIYDTVSIAPYQLPIIGSSTFLHIAANTIQCTVNGALGIPPYTYQILATMPPGGQTGPTSNNTFLVLDTMPSGPITFIKMQISDACNNSIINNIYPSFALPLKELRAEAWLSENTALVKWKTLDEKNVQNFTIQRSLNGVDFMDFSQKKAFGNTTGYMTYSIDDDISTWLNYPFIYYRVVANDFDSHATYSNILNISPQKGAASVQVFPTPFSSGINIQYINNQNSKIFIKLFDVQQRMIASKIVYTQQGLFESSLDQLSSLSRGIYIIQILDEKSGEKFMQKLMKE